MKTHLVILSGCYKITTHDQIVWYQYLLYICIYYIVSNAIIRVPNETNDQSDPIITRYLCCSGDDFTIKRKNLTECVSPYI